MQKWEKAARRFIEECAFKDDIDVAFLTGSYTKGLSDEFSDVDLYIVLREGVDWRERGNKRVDGFLIEYFANPFWQIKKYIEDSRKSVCLMDINMILGGILIFGDDAKARQIKDYCKQKMAEDFPQMSDFAVKNALYHLWDSFDELERAYVKKSADFSAHFYGFVKIAYEYYSRHKRFPAPLFAKAYRWLSNEEYFANFGYPPYGDEKFANKIKTAFECENFEQKFALAKDIHAYVVDGMGGFDINNYVLHSKIRNEG